MKIIAKVRYVDFQKRSHMIEIESDSADRRHLEEENQKKDQSPKVCRRYELGRYQEEKGDEA